jgi:hypothetical protein
MSRIVCCSLMLSVTLISGCGDGGSTAHRLKTVPAAGVVTLGGQPVEGATVTLTGPPGRPAAFAVTDSGGRFVLSTYGNQDGAVPGDFSVGVRKIELQTVPDPKDPNLPPISSKEIFHVPEKFRDPSSSGLKLSVPDSGKDDLMIELAK